MRLLYLIPALWSLIALPLSFRMFRTLAREIAPDRRRDLSLTTADVSMRIIGAAGGSLRLPLGILVFLLLAAGFCLAFGDLLLISCLFVVAGLFGAGLFFIPAFCACLWVYAARDSILCRPLSGSSLIYSFLVALVWMAASRLLIAALLGPEASLGQIEMLLLLLGTEVLAAHYAFDRLAKAYPYKEE